MNSSPVETRQHPPVVDPRVEFDDDRTAEEGLEEGVGVLAGGHRGQGTKEGRNNWKEGEVIYETP